jgi:hypothetical protein
VQCEDQSERFAPKKTISLNLHRTSKLTFRKRQEYLFITRFTIYDHDERQDKQQQRFVLALYPSPRVSLMGFRRADNRSAQVRRCNSLTVCFTILSCLQVLLLADGSSPSSASSGLEGVAVASQFVSAAPLIVAAACRNGVAVVATHTSTDDEPLLYHSTSDEQDIVEDKKDTQSLRVKDLPLGYGGPFRIHPIDSFGTALVSAGWRADCEVLAARCRSIAASQVISMGPPAPGRLYGHFCSTELSFYMAQCAVSERVSLWLLGSLRTVRYVPVAFLRRCMSFLGVLLIFSVLFFIGRCGL